MWIVSTRASFALVDIRDSSTLHNFWLLCRWLADDDDDDDDERVFQMNLIILQAYKLRCEQRGEDLMKSEMKFNSQPVGRLQQQQCMLGR